MTLVTYKWISNKNLRKKKKKTKPLRSDFQCHLHIQNSLPKCLLEKTNFDP